jgi:putative ABC transport system permease protein
MNGILRLALPSLANRRWTALLCILSIAVSVMLVLGVERLRKDARESFANTIAGADLIVGARSGSVQLLLYSVFRIGNPVANILWKSHQDMASDPRVAWTIPMSLGDSHRGFRVLGTSTSYFEHYRYADGRALVVAEGKAFDDLYDVVLGSAVAAELGYRLGDRIIVQHGLGTGIAKEHDDRPFTVAGILAPTGTPVDRTLHVSLEGIEAMHVGFSEVRGNQRRKIDAEAVRELDLQPRGITAFIIGLKSKTSIFSVQRDINRYRAEPLMAILPGVAMHELWSVLGTVETALGAITACVALSALLGMITMLLAGLNERRREMAVLRAVGARPGHILLLLISEAVLLTFSGAVVGLAGLSALYLFAAGWAGETYGLYLSSALPQPTEWMLLGIILVAGALSGLVPAWRALRQSLADGLIPKV